MERYVKFLSKLPAKLRIRLIKTIEKIARNDLKNLDIKALKGKDNVYRCRIGDVRIIFQKSKPENIIYDIGFRGGIY